MTRIRHFKKVLLVSLSIGACPVLSQDSSGIDIRRSPLPDIGKTIPHAAGITAIRDTVIYYQAHEDRLVFSETIVSHGFTDEWGCRFTLPIVINYKRLGHESAGASDFRAELSYNFYLQSNFLANIIVGIQLPTGNFNKVPGLSTGSYDFLGQLSFVHLSKKWYMGHLTQALITGHHRKYKSGNRYTIEFGFGPRIELSPHSTSEFFILGQFFMLFVEQDRFNHIRVPNTGFQVLFLGPILSWTHPHGLVEINFGLPIGQRTNDNLPKFDFRASLTLELRF